MRSALLSLALIAAACSPKSPGMDEDSIPPPPAGPGEFDDQQWLERARAAYVSLEEAAGEEGTESADRMKALTAELAEAVDWRRACDTYLDYETGEEMYDFMEPELSSWVRGTYEIGDVSVTEALVAVTCDFGAYQGSYALVHIDRDGARLLSATAYDLDGTELAGRQTTFSTPDFSALGAGSFSTFARARGLGDCGIYSTYALEGAADARVVEVRSRDCGDVIPDDLPPPTEWPVVYPEG